MSEIEELEEKKKRLELERSIKILETQKKVIEVIPSKRTLVKIVKVAAILAVLCGIIVIISGVFYALGIDLFS